MNIQAINDPAISIYDSFRHAVFQPPTAAEEPSAHTSGSTTKESSPPQFLLNVEASVWMNMSGWVLQKGRATLERAYLPTREVGASYKSEGDVVAGATLELNHPVNVAIKAYEPAIRYGREMISPSRKARADKVYYTVKPDGSNLYFAVLDYKTVSVLNAAQFLKGTVTSKEDFRRRINAFHDKLEVGTNAWTISKQAVNYSFQFDTPFVAFFDMRTLVLFVFCDRQDIDGGDYVFVTVITKPDQMRRAFLGFLRLAHGHKGMTDQEWKEKMISPEQRGWFEAAGRAWSNGGQGSVRR